MDDDINAQREQRLAEIVFDRLILEHCREYDTVPEALEETDPQTVEGFRDHGIAIAAQFMKEMF